MISSPAVIVTCYEPYLRWLPEALRSIDRQLPENAERVVAFDGCAPPRRGVGSWQVLSGSWGHPAGARNAGIEATHSPWLIFWDADNVMADGYFDAARRAASAASDDIAIIYPDILYCDRHMVPQYRQEMPDWDYWKLRAENFVDTAALWRREAIELAGGWPSRARAFCDYGLALDITALGWQAARLREPPLYKRTHEQSRLHQHWRDGDVLGELWRLRSLAIVSLLAGREQTFGRWVDFLTNAELPPRTALYVVDNSGSPEFSRMAHAACRRIAQQRKMTHLDFSIAGSAYQAAPIEHYFVERRHLHIASRYAALLPRVAEDLVLTLEDDVEPPLDAVRRLGEEIGYRSRANLGAVAGVYASPVSAEEICAGMGGDRWTTPIYWHQVGDAPLPVDFVGGGCTIWANWALRAAPTHFWWDRVLGWDGARCLTVRRSGYEIRLHGGVRCLHHTHGRLNDAPPPPPAGTANSPIGPPGAREEAAMSTTAEHQADSQALLPWTIAQLTAAWAQALGGDAQARAQWQVSEGDGWSWHDDGPQAGRSKSEWTALRWNGCGPTTLRSLQNVLIEVWISGQARAAGISFGPYKDFLAPVSAASGPRQIQLELDAAANRWLLRIDGQIAQPQWWNSAVTRLEDVLGGTLTLKVQDAEQIQFHNLAIRAFDSTCRLSIVVTCYRFLQRLRVALRNWCNQAAPSGLYEVLVVNPDSPDGAHAHLAASAASYPEVRLRELAVDPVLSINKGALINRGIDASQGEWVWLADADCLYGPGTVTAVLEQIAGRADRLFYAQRRYLTVVQTQALLSGRRDGLADFEAIAQATHARPPDSAPWGFTQIVHRSTLARVRYREHLKSYGASDLQFIEDCKQAGIAAEAVPGLFCLHLEHPFAHHGTKGFL